MGLSDVIGDTPICRQIESLIASHRLPHAIVLEGSVISKGRSAAQYIAKASVCSSDIDCPCERCQNCRKADEDIHPDIYTVKITDKKQAIGVGEIRTMISDCFIKPNEASGKVYLIFDKMTTEAQNALLKILEEPPQNVRFIIVTESSSTLLQTVRSRSAIFKIEDSSEQEKDLEADMLAKEIAVAITNNVELPLLIATGKLVNNKVLMQRVLDRLSVILNMAIEERYVPSQNVPQYVTDIARSLRKRSIIKLQEVVAQAETMLAQNCNMNLLVTWLCASIRRSRHTN
ncbi:MAG: hypothetical protein K2M82_00580 [Lachnospiraceae bacterium]|nr:hypothetical protein [Lachnospiraceae bacterium]